MNTIINGDILRTMILAGAGKLEREKSQIDSLNVFPVPDGDTGTNMYLTLVSAAKAIQNLPKNCSLPQVAESMAHGALMGARGNSGVILSQLLGGFAKAVNDSKVLDSNLLAKAFSQGVEAAYKAVVKPVEGTILTVAREATEKLINSLKDEVSLDQALEIFLEQGYLTLSKTPEMLPVLKQAGVVDAGGKGFLTIIEGMLLGLKGKDAADYLIEEAVISSQKTLSKIQELQTEPEDITYQYCTELIIKKRNNVGEDTEIIRKYLEKQGDSVVVVNSDGIIKIHVHTNHPGLVLEYCGQIGSLHNIKIDNMWEQNELLQQNIMKSVGVIAVSVGEGLNEIFRSLGVDYIITGGQTMNPSTEDILLAIEQINAKEVLILPNNKNIILAAQQACSVTNKPAKVISSKSIPQGIGALMAFNGELDLDTNYERMQEAINEIKTGEVTYAVRDAEYKNLQIKSGQIMGIIDGEITVIGEEIEQVVIDMLKDALLGDEDLVTLYYGSDIKEAQGEELVNKLASLYPDIDFELHYGGQPLYYYLISIE